MLPQGGADGQGLWRSGTAPLQAGIRGGTEIREAEEAAKGPATVRIPGRNYEIGKYEVTQKEWRDIMGNNPSNFSNCGDSDAYLLELARYIVLNPVRAGMVKKPEHWVWSSYRASMGLETVPAWLAQDGLLAMFAKRRSLAQQRYAQFVAEGINADSPWANYRTVQTHLATWLALQEDRVGACAPAVTEREFRRYLACGILAHGLARARCADCGHDFLVAYSCKCRGVCPSCTTRRMVETAAHLADHVIPRLPVRQWVLSVPNACATTWNAIRQFSTLHCMYS